MIPKRHYVTLCNLLSIKKGGLMEKLLTIDELAEQLQVSTRSVNRYVESGRLKPTRLARSTRFRDEDINAFLNFNQDEEGDLMEKLLTSRDVASLLQVTPRMVNKYVKMGILKPTRLLQRTRFKNEDVRNFINNIQPKERSSKNGIRR
jgi:excisionase family DNA binding protein